MKTADNAIVGQYERLHVAAEGIRSAMNVATNVAEGAAHETTRSRMAERSDRLREALHLVECAKIVLEECP